MVKLAVSVCAFLTAFRVVFEQHQQFRRFLSCSRSSQNSLKSPIWFDQKQLKPRFYLHQFAPAEPLRM